MSINGTITSVLSKNALERGTESALTAGLMDANEVAKSQDVKNGKKSTLAKVNPNRKK